MTEIPTIVTYHSTNNQPPWFAYLKPGGEFLGVRMEGATESEAIERAKNWWINEKRHQERLTGALELEDNEVGSKSYKPVGTAWGNPPPTSGWSNAPSNNGWTAAPNRDGREHGLTGKVWLINHVLKQKLRADPDKVGELLAQGWEKSGPRTEFRE